MPPTPFDFGPELINVLVNEPGPGSIPALTAHPPAMPLNMNARLAARANSVNLQAKINQLAASGGYIYFPSGRYLLGRPARSTIDARIETQMRADIVVPPSVTLWFAAGAALVPLANEPMRDDLPGLEGRRDTVRVEIQGDIIAELQQIFEVVDDLTIANLDAWVAGTILLAGNRIREVYPEWWGTTPDDNARGHRRNRLALQAAIDAAYNNRTTPRLNADGSVTTFWNRRPAVPVVLTGSYFMDGALVVGKAMAPDNPLPPTGPVPTGGFEMRGAGGMTNGRGNLVAGRQPLRDTSLLVIRGPVSFSIQNVNFNANSIMDRCVTIEPVDNEWGYSAFEGCNFERCLRELVHLDAETRRRTRAGSLWNSKWDFWNITFTRCYFLPQPLEVNMTDLMTRVGFDHVSSGEGNFIGINAHLEDNEGLELRGCVLGACASPMIRAFSGRFALNECNLHTSQPPGHPNITGMSGLNGKNDALHGTDVSIEKPANQPGTRRGLLARRVVPAALTAKECESHSVQFLATPERTGPDQADDEKRSAVVLLNLSVSHERQGAFFATGRTQAPAIFWGYPGRVGCALVMIACTVRGFRREGDEGGPEVEPATLARTRDDLHRFNRQVVYYEPPLRGPIYDVAGDNRTPPAILNQPGRIVFPIDPSITSRDVRRLRVIIPIGALGVPRA